LINIIFYFQFFSKIRISIDDLNFKYYPNGENILNDLEKQSLKADFKIAFKEIRIAILERFVNSQSEDESYLLSRAELLSIPKKKQLLKSIFINSKWFGETIKSEFKKLWTIEEIKEVLPFTGIPCLLGFWQPNQTQDAFTLKHYTCNYEPNLLKCRYWYNAINGMITGLSDKVSFARHDSIGNDDQVCTNIIYNSEKTDQDWKGIPEEITNKFKHLTAQLKKFGIIINLTGYADGTLFYQTEENFKNKFLLSTIIKLFSLREPKLQFINLSDKKNYSRQANTNI
jgi:hypothetical protein